MIHLVGFTAMLHEGLCDDVRGGGFVYGHSRDLGTTGFIALSMDFPKYKHQST